MLKRILAVAIAVVLVMSMAVVAVSAADTDSASAGAEVSNSAGADTSNSGTGAGKLIYFDASKWNNVNLVYCHIWERGGDPFYSWQSKAEGCTKDKSNPNLWAYDLSKLDASTTVSGGLQSGKDYCVIFSANTGVQTFDQTFGTACIGDTARVTGKMIENAVDSEKEAYESVWKTNSAKYGPHLALSSTGKIIGSVLCPNEKGEEVIGDWLPNYCNHDLTYGVDVVKCLKDALLKFNVKDIEAVYAYILSKETQPSAADKKKMLGQLQDAYKLAYPQDKEGAKIDTEKAEKDANTIKNSGGSVTAVTGGSTTSTGSTNSSGSGSDGQADTLFIILGAVMVLAAGTMIFARKKREE
ncbi:MAG: hypothetical protein PUD53_05205 [Oscillospiraceae bacterium]|nr:hypothetical protein [Oscillospiraceae bacterium]